MLSSLLLSIDLKRRLTTSYILSADFAFALVHVVYLSIATKHWDVLRESDIVCVKTDLNHKIKCFMLSC